MLQDMHNIESSWVFYVKVGIFDQLEQSKVCIVTVTNIGIVRLTMQHDLISASVSCMIPGIS